jgi:chromosomal replication initiator protein
LNISLAEAFFQQAQEVRAPGNSLTTCERTLAPRLTQRIGESRYRLWFDGKTKFRQDGDLLIVGVPNRFYQDWLQNKFSTAVREVAQEVTGSLLEVQFVIDPELFRAAREAEEAARAALAAAPAVSAAPARDDVSEAQAIAPRQTRASTRWRRLEDFIAGPATRVAHASALSLIEQPDQAPSPLVFYGPTGVGKTHLLEGIAQHFLQFRRDWKVCYLTAEDFTNRFLASLSQGKSGGFRKFFRDVDLLLIDDLQFLARKRATREEFLHTLNALTSRRGIVVVSCDCHPRLSDDFTPELIDRLLGGASWSLQPPEAETRLAILRAKAAGREPAIPEPVLRHLSQHLRGNVRELEGAILTLQHFCRVSGRPVDKSAVQESLRDLLRHVGQKMRVADIDHAVCDTLDITRGCLQSGERAWHVSHPRMIAMYLARKHTAASHTEIGRHFGGRNHSTVVAAEKKVRSWISTDLHIICQGERKPIAEILSRIEHRLNR